MRRQPRVGDEIIVVGALPPSAGDYYRIFALLVLCSLLTAAAAEQLSAQLANPCEFPSPELPFFSTLCQFDYHQLPYLCDPSGLMSRTETELLDRQIRRLLNGHNATGCVCPPPTASAAAARRLSPTDHHHHRDSLRANAGATGYGRSRMDADASGGSGGGGAAVCDDQLRRRENSLRINVVLVPYSNMESINLCLQRQRLLSNVKRGGGGADVDVSDFLSASLAYAQQLMARWVDALPAAAARRSSSSSSSQRRYGEAEEEAAERAAPCSGIDLFLVYIQHWMPNSMLRPFVVRLYRNHLKTLKHLESAHRAQSDASPFETILEEMMQAIRLTQNTALGKHKSGSKSDAHGRLYASENLLVENSTSANLATEGIPYWAYILVGSLLAIVVLAVYLGNCVNRRLTLTQQQKKYSAAATSRHGAAAAALAGAERHRLGFGGGGFLAMSGGGNSSGAGAGGAGGALGVSGISTGGPLGANTKSSMMFRHFAGPGRRQATTAGRSSQVQKI